MDTIVWIIILIVALAILGLVFGGPAWFAFEVIVVIIVVIIVVAIIVLVLQYILRRAH